MLIEFYHNVSDTRKAVKNIGQVLHTIDNAVIYRECSLMNPEFLVEYSPVEMVSNYIYAGIVIDSQPYGAYYFIKDHILLPGGKMVITCQRDVLSTWWSRLKDCTANVIRQEQITNQSKFMFDDKMTGKSSTHVINIPFSENPFSLPESNKYCVLLTVLGGVHTTPPTVESTTEGGAS